MNSSDEDVIKKRFPRIQGCITVFIGGPVSSGKTYLIKRMVDGFERSLILDAGADYLSESYGHVWSNPRELASVLAQNPYAFRLAYHPNQEFFQEEFHWSFASIWSLSHPRWFIVEEAHEVCANNALHPDANTLLRYSRHNLLGVVFSSQRIADVDKLVTSSARLVVLFHTAEFRDIEAARLRWGPKVSEALERLRPCIYDDETQECLQHPECVVIVKGKGFRVIALGDKVLSQQQQPTEENLWQQHQEADDEAESEELPTPGASSLEQDSGTQD